MKYSLFANLSLPRIEESSSFFLHLSNLMHLVKLGSKKEDNWIKL